MSIFGKMNQMRDEESKADETVKDDVRDEVIEETETPAEETQDAEVEEVLEDQPAPSAVSEFLKSKGILEEGDDSALMGKVWSKLEQQERELAYYRQQQQQPQKQPEQPEQSVQQPEAKKPSLPRYDRNWNAWMEDGALKQDAPMEVRQAYREAQEFEELRLTNPQEYYNRVFREGIDKGFLKEMVEPMVRDMIGGQLQQVESQRQVQAIEEQLSAKLTVRSESGQSYFDSEGNPVYNDLGKQVMPIAMGLIQDAGIDANAEPLKAMKIIERVVASLEQKQSPAEPKKQITLQEKRAQDQEKLNHVNRLNGTLDPGGERNGNRANGVEHQHVPNNRRHYVPSFKDRLKDYAERQAN